MEMKPYFMDELWSLKQEAPITKKQDYNQNEKTSLKKKNKTIGIWKSTFKCDVCNKQKFIETLLDVMSHDIDVAPASSITYDYHVTSEPQHIRENQNCETSDTDNNDRRKRDYKPNNENKKGDDNNKEKKKSKQDNSPTSTNNKKGYSIVKPMQGWQLTNSLENNYNVCVRSSPGAKVWRIVLSPVLEKIIQSM